VTMSGVTVSGCVQLCLMRDTVAHLTRDTPPRRLVELSVMGQRDRAVLQVQRRCR
jgi:hypothetical protein